MNRSIRRRIGGNRYLLFSLAAAFVLLLFSQQRAFAAIRNPNHEYESRLLTRGEVVSTIVTSFQLAERESSFLTSCQNHLDECFFVFSAMSDFDGIAFEPFLSLYPDVTPNSRFYHDINVASMLGLVHGYLQEEDTPFRPEIVMSRIQALKIVLGASDLMDWEERFEVSEEETVHSTPYLDEALTYEENWWYNRYLNFAFEHGITPKIDYFRPDEIITVGELNEMIQKAQMASKGIDDQLQSQAFAIRNPGA